MQGFARFGWIELCSTSLDNRGHQRVNDCTSVHYPFESETFSLVNRLSLIEDDVSRTSERKNMKIEAIWDKITRGDSFNSFWRSFLSWIAKSVDVYSKRITLKSC